MVDPAPGGGVFLLVGVWERELEGGVRGRASPETDLYIDIYTSTLCARPPIERTIRRTDCSDSECRRASTMRLLLSVWALEWGFRCSCVSPSPRSMSFARRGLRYWRALCESSCRAMLGVRDLLVSIYKRPEIAHVSEFRR